MNAIERIKSVIPTLNHDQLAAVKATEGPVLIIAGPGTGKTLTMVARTLYLLLSGRAQPEEIVLTTFTEKAAFELRDRVSQLAQKLNYKDNLHQLRVGTIHSLCNDFIVKFLTHTPLRRGYSILDELTQQFFIYEHFDALAPNRNGLFWGRWRGKWESISIICRYFNKITEELIDVDRLAEAEDGFLRLLAKSYRKYQEKLREKNRVDFSHLQKIFLDLLKNREIYPRIKKNIKYIMVDEYQDTNYIQEQILLKLARPENNICVVGDEDQALYRFRGATVRNILEFPSHFPHCRQIKLTINYRSHPDIIQRYNKFITSTEWNGFRYPKQVQPDPEGKFPDYPAVFCIWGKDEKDEAARVVKLLKFLKDNNIIQDWADVALLMKSIRAENSSHYIEALRKNNIPYFAPRAKRFFENEEIKLLLAAYAIIFGFMKEFKNDYPHREHLENSLKVLANAAARHHSLKHYLKKKRREIENLQTGSLDLTVLDYLYGLLAHEPFSSYLKDENSAYNLAIFSRLISIFQDYYNISLVTAKNKEHIKSHLFRSFFNFLLDSGIDEYEDPDNPIPKGHVQIMTIHQAKGLEFPVVIVNSLHKRFIVQKHVDRDLLPFSRRGTYETEDQMTQFDRLRHYYVAFSRAQKILVLSTPEHPKEWFAPIWEGLDQYPRIESETLAAQRFSSRPQFIPKKSYSLTGVNIYETCPLQYLFYHDYQFQPSRAGQVLFGALVHHTIEDIHRAVLEGQKKIFRDQIENWLEDNYQALLLTGLRPISRAGKEFALRQVQNYYNQNRDLLSRIRETEVEVSVEKEDYIITGKIDLLLGEEGKLELLDFKTQTRPAPGHPIIDRYRRQLCLYAHIIRERYNREVEKMYIYWTGEPERVDALQELRYCEADVEEAGRHFDQVVQRIRAKHFQVEQQPDPEKVCKECDFRFYCSQNGIIRFKPREWEER
ncbi:MAG: ATP-dependent helicase [candidate division WOR-3 bacterium]|uniref:DNA 3'-5' helicase n=1 Tax=candidate division WOR-3 bacterium TaxID=2052148 RepID=A0A7C1SDE2_UNCW3|nr:ATP-dependent helicase [candidate division WOR-3 bacterium]